MYALEKYSNNKYVKIGILILIFLGWLIPYINKENYQIFEIIFQFIIGIMASIFLLIFKNTFLVLEIILLFPFMFSRGLTLYTIPIHLYILVPLLVISFVLHLVIFKQKLKKPLFLIGLILMLVSVVFGGSLVGYEDKLTKMLMLFLVCSLLLFLYIFFSSTTNMTFYDLSFAMLLLGILIISQLFVYGIINPNSFLLNKGIETGWASNSNNIAMMLLFTFPFTFYLGLKNIKFKRYLYYVFSYLTIFVIIITYSRGAIFSGLISFVAMLITLSFFKETKRSALCYLGYCFAFIFVVLLGIYIVSPQVFNTAIMQLTKIDFNNLNGRRPIYESVIKKYLSEPIFGQGLFSPYISDTFYLWAHNTFLEAASTLGTIGLIAIIYHHVEKYVFCFKGINTEKIIILFSFIATDIYGFIDVNYFFINFMIVLFFIMICSNSIFLKNYENVL